MIIICFASASYARNIIWRDEQTLFGDVVKKAPNKTRGKVALSMATNSSDLIIGRYEAALRINPDQVEAHNNLGIAYKTRGLTEKAIEQYLAAVRIDPDRAETYNNLGNVYDALGSHDKAIAYYEIAIKKQPAFALAHYNLGIAYEYKGLTDKAIEHYRMAVSIWPDFMAAQRKVDQYASH